MLEWSDRCSSGTPPYLLSKHLYKALAVGTAPLGVPLGGHLPQVQVIPALPVVLQAPD